MTAPMASGRSDLAGWVSHPLVKRRLTTGHANCRRSYRDRFGCKRKTFELGFYPNTFLKKVGSLSYLRLIYNGMVNLLEIIYSTKLINPRSVSGIISVADYEARCKKF